MPSHILHQLVDILMFGRVYPKVHSAMDAAQATMQSNHRVFFHDDVHLVRTIGLENSIEAGWSFFYHVELDGISDEVGQDQSVPELVSRLLTGGTPFYFSPNGLLVRIAGIGISRANLFPIDVVPPRLSYVFK